MYESRWHGQLIGWLASLTLEDEAGQGLSLPSVVYEFKDVFSGQATGITSIEGCKVCH